MTARDRLVVVVVAVVAALAGSWFLVLAPKRDQASKLGDQVANAQQQLDSARTELSGAQSDRGAYARNYTTIASLGQAVPPDDNVPSLIFQLQNAATEARVDFRVLKLNAGAAAATPVAAASAAAAPPAAARASSGTTAGIAPGASPGTAASTVPGATVGPAGFPTMSFTFNFDGNFFHLSDFFNRLERFVVASNKRVSVSGRLMTLNAINLSQAKAGFPHMTATISATSYLVPPTQGLTGGATPIGPSSSTGTQSASASGSQLPAATAAIASPVR
jgi:hypothetical protein